LAQQAFCRLVLLLPLLLVLFCQGQLWSNK
jgi:hypothetical protein